MALKQGKSDATVSKNIKTLMNEKPKKRRAKAINTIAKRQHISLKKAKQKQSIAIALSEAGRSKYKKKK